MSNKFDKVVKLFLFLTPVCYLTNFSLIQFDVILFQIAVTALFMAYLLEPNKREVKFGYLIPSFMGIMIFNILIHHFDLMVVNKSINMLLFMFAIYIISSACKKPEECKKFIMYALLTNFLIMLLQKIGVVSIPGEWGLMGNGPRLAIYTSVVLFFLPTWLIFLSVGIVVLFLKETCILLPFLIYLYSVVKIFWLHIFFLLVPLFFCRQHILNSINTRICSLKMSLDYFAAMPMIGLGWGNLMKEHTVRDTMTMSSILDYVVGVGISGLIWLSLAIKNFIKKFDGQKEDFAILSLILLCMIEYPFEIPRLWFTLAFIISFYLISKTKAQYGT